MPILLDDLNGMPPSASPSTDDRTDTVRILVVDDERSLTRILRSMLEHDGYVVEECSTTSGLIDRIAENPPDLAILDYHMPEMNGLEVLAGLRARIGDRVPVIMLTGESENIEVAVRSIKHGAMDYLVKPVAMERLLSSVRVALRVQRLRDEGRRLAAENSGLWRLAGAVFLLDAQHQVLRMSLAAEQLLGLGLPDCAGRRFEALLGAELAPPDVFARFEPASGMSEPIAFSAGGHRGFAMVLPGGNLLVSLEFPSQAPRPLTQRARMRAPRTKTPS